MSVSRINSPSGARPLVARLLHSENLPDLLPVFMLTPVIWLLAVVVVQAHDAPSGWSYPFQCCSGYDCRPVTATTISTRPEGYVITGTGEVVGYGDTRVRTSPDGAYHWCSVAGADDGKTLCLFVPQQLY